MPTVLVVDDEPHLCELYRQDLLDEGYDVVTVRSGAEALRILSERHVDVVVLDIAMPGMDGIETLNKILAIDNRLPVILNTAYACYQENFMTWPAEAYVVKSSDVTELLTRVREALEKRGVAPPDPPLGEES